MTIDQPSLFGTDPAPCWSLGEELRCQQVSPVTAQRWFGQYHYSHTIGRTSLPIGVFAGDMLALVGMGNGNVAGLSQKFNLSAHPGDWEIARVAVHPDAPRNTASQAIAAALRFYHLLTGHEWVYSYADTGQGHHGGIYQALNAVYVGLISTTPLTLIDGVPHHSRVIWDMFGTNRAKEVEAACRVQGRSFAMEPGTPKHCYILPIGGRVSRRAIRAILAPSAQAYPKREAH